jgi:zinc and cadmium transporter
MNGTGLLALYCAAILAASMAGGWLPLVLRPTHIRLQTYLSFASGVMLGAAMCHMLPEASEQAPRSWFYWTLGGLLALFFLERFFAFHHHEVPESTCEHGHEHAPEPERGQSPLAWRAALFGLSVHTLTGGFALASAVAAESGKSGAVGISVFLATLLHKPADSLTITSLMVTEGTRPRFAHLANLGFALMIPIGVLFYFLARGSGAANTNTFTGGALAFSAGTFLSIALGDLMPELQFHRHDRLQLSIALLAGVAVMFGSALLGG